MVVFPKRQLALAVALSIQAAASSAQPVADLPAPAAGPMEEIVVAALPIRDSQRAAILAKRDADHVVDVIAADTIGRFPDQNLADALARVPALAVERDQGQARYVNFRGAPFRYTSLAIDGLQLPGAENGRVPRFDSFPAVITSRIEANKAVTAAMPGESIAGFINIDTFNPFAKEGLGLSLDLGHGQQQLGNGDVDSRSLRLSWSNDHWGVMVYGSDDSREQITDNREYGLAVDDASGDLLAEEIEFRSYKVERENTSRGGRLEYRFDDDFSRLFVSYLESEFTDHEERNQYVFESFTGVAPGTSGRVEAGRVDRMLQDGEYRNSTETAVLGADVLAGSWEVSARYAHTETENEMFLPMIRSVYGRASYEYDIRDLEDPKLYLFESGTNNPIPVGDVNYALTLGLPISSELNVQSDQIKLDAARDFHWRGREQRVQWGLLHDRRESDGHGTSVGQLAFPASIDIGDYDTGTTWDSDFTNTIGGTYIDNPGLLDAWEAVAGPITPVVDETQKVAIEEQISALYAMNTTQFGWGNLVYGVRVEYTDYTSTGPDADYSDDFTNVLPSLHLNYELAEDHKLRLSLTSGISRPTYNEWRASAGAFPLTETISGGNPTLEPEEALGLDAAWEWYLGDGSLVSVGAFYRAIDNVIYNAVSPIDPGFYYPPAAGETWDFVGTVNGRDGELQGLEFNLIAQASDMFAAAEEGFLSGFGFSASASVLDSEFETLEGETYSLPGTSDLVYSTSVYYENEALSVRLNYQYRDDWLTATESDGMAQYWAEQKRLDLSLRYTLPFALYGAEVSLYLNANNLTDAVDVRYTGSEATPDQVERYGRRYMAGVRVNF